MIICQRLEFKNVYPEEKPKKIEEYLSFVPINLLLNLIGFSNTSSQPNYVNFFKNPEIKLDVITRVSNYHKENELILISREASLKLAEIILSNRNVLLKDNNLSDVDASELNLFKAYLIINKELNKKNHTLFFEDSEPIDQLVQIMIASLFPISDIGTSTDSHREFTKLVYCTIIKFELLVEFLQSNPDYKYLLEGLLEYFNTEDIEGLTRHIKNLFLELLNLKDKNNFKIEADNEFRMFLNSLISSDIIADDDFINLRNHPIYKVNEGVYSIIDYFFVVDKFYKSLKFILKDKYNEKHKLLKNNANFFGVFGKEFSEDFLMKNILDKLFDKKHFVKKEVSQRNGTHEPDYYVRYDKRIFIFENKDILIRKDIKSSGNIEEILRVLRDKLLKDNNNRPVGIGQLVTSISQIVEKTFEYDNSVNTKNNFTIYPILLINDRILEVPGINYILNQWYLKEIKNKLGEKYNSNFIKNLTLIDIDTIILSLDYFIKKDRNFRDFIDKHLKEMSTKKNLHCCDKYFILSYLQRLASPISQRFDFNNFPLLKDMFSDLVDNKTSTFP